MSNTKHGLSHLPEYTVWKAMRRRCFSPNCPNFSRYGGRGITVCARWDSFEKFYEDMGPRPSPQHSIERKNNNHGYSPSNCVWATVKEQMRNRCDNSWVVVNGESMILSDATRVLKVSRDALYVRVSRGMTPQQAVDTPITPRKK